MEPAFYQYWGKAKKAANSDGADFHLLPYHSLDVAACGYLLLADEMPWGERLAAQLNISVAQLQRLFGFWLSLHDLGKFAQAFQNLAPNLSTDLIAFNEAYVYHERHDSLGYCLFRHDKELQQILAEFCGLSAQRLVLSETLNCWSQVVTGHHGQPPKAALRNPEQFFSAADLSAARDFVRTMLAFWLKPEDACLLCDKALKSNLLKASWQLAGLAVLADWHGSDQSYFRYENRLYSLDDYWQQYALPSAQQALKGASIETLKARPFQSLQQLFPYIKTPTPLQQYAVEQPLTDEPQLFILEDVTGAGKTEAALTLVHRLLAKSLATGLYIGLPTMATANAMYQRLANCYTQFFPDDVQPSLVLAHGASQLNDTFQQSLLVNDQPIDNNYTKNELSASAYCNHWLADSRKKALLASVGVGTLDQALLSVLPARHQSLRLLGLASKVLLVDEVHAYDPYMRTLLAKLLELHARQGGSAILLSATLPQSLRKLFVGAYSKGRAFEAPPLEQQHYPLATQVPAKHSEIPLATRSEVQRQVKVSRLNDTDAALATIRTAVNAGQCVCWIRNTVDEARASYAALQAQLAPQSLHLFHSRYAMCDRQAIEQQVLAIFGKNGSAEQRCGQVLISTQVVEQSLDLDFDVMLSDIAPIDLLLQRAGRLQRHTRDRAGNPHSQEQRDLPTLHIVCPDPADDVDGSWLAPDNGSRLVYQDLALLWRSARLLLDNGGYRMPEDARYLIEQVYAEDSPLVAPEALFESSLKAEGEQRAAASIALTNALKLNKGYSQQSNDIGWREDVNVPTRLTDNTVSVVLLQRDSEGCWLPYARTARFAWELSQLSLRDSHWQQASKQLSDEVKNELKQFQAATPALKWHQLFPLIGEWQDFYSEQQGWLGLQGEQA